MRDWIDSLDRKVFPFVEYPGYASRYPALSGISLPREKCEELREASRCLFAIFSKACQVARRGDDRFFRAMDIPEHIRPYLSIPNPFSVPTWLSRFDFVLDNEGQFHMVELNADTPCAVVEAYYGNGVYCRHFHKEDPNAGAYDKLKGFLLRIHQEGFRASADLKTAKLVASRPFVFSCFPDYIEDYGTTMFLMHAMQEAVSETHPMVPAEESIRFASFYDLQVDKDIGACLLPDGTQAGALYRLHPMELLVEERAGDGYPIGTRLLDGYADSRFLLFNPPEAVLMQSKAFLALVWSLMLDGRFFTKEEARIIRKYLPASYFSMDDAPKEKDRVKPLIHKPVWGREGVGIFVTEKGERILRKEVPDADDVVRRDSSHDMVQEFIQQKRGSVLADDGQLEGYLTLSCFMLMNEPSALYARFSEHPVAGTEAYWVPLCY